ncbi:MAG TPA: dockerin type I domain-containing protein, partial [Pirellulales bacterium]
MRCQCICSCVVIAAVISLSLFRQAAAGPPDILRDYRFIPSQSTVVVTGGTADYALKLNIAGRFDLITGYDGGGPTPLASPPSLQPFAKFTDVHGTIYNPLSASPLLGWDLDKTLNLSGLAGTFNTSDPNQLYFFGADGNGEAFRLEADITGPWIHLTGGTSDPKSTSDPRYQVDALAHLLPFPDFDADSAITLADISTMLSALSNPQKYETANNLSTDDFLSMSDINGDGSVTNADLQALISMVANSAAGTGAVTSIPEPSSLLLFCGGVIGSV